MKKMFNGWSLKQKLSKKKGKTSLSLLGGTAALAALAPSASAGALTFEGIDTGLNVSDAVQTGINFMKIFGDWTNLVLGAIIALALIGIVIWLVSLMPSKKKKTS